MTSEDLVPSYLDKNRDGIDLMRPSLFMPILAELIQDELLFFSHDMNGKVTYISKSAESVLRTSPNSILNRTFPEMLTEDTCNDKLRDFSWETGSPLTAISGTCMLRGSEDSPAPIKLKYWRVHVIDRGNPIGVSGILRRLDTREPRYEFLAEPDADELMARVETLTPVEFQVVDLVVDGHMNKESAAILNVAVRTIESRRSRAMAKLKASGLSDLVQTWVQVKRFLNTDKYKHLDKSKTFDRGNI